MKLKEYANKFFDHLLSPTPTVVVYVLIIYVMSVSYSSRQRDAELGVYIRGNHELLVKHQELFATQNKLDSAWNEELGNIHYYQMVTARQYLELTNKFSTDSVIYSTIYFDPTSNKVPFCPY